MPFSLSPLKEKSGASPNSVGSRHSPVLLGAAHQTAVAILLLHTHFILVLFSMLLLENRLALDSEASAWGKVSLPQLPRY